MSLTQLYAIMLAALRALGLVPRAPEPPPEDPPPPPETAGEPDQVTAAAVSELPPSVADVAAQAHVPPSVGDHELMTWSEQLWREATARRAAEAAQSAAQARDSDWVDDCLDLPRPGIGLGSAHAPPTLGPSPPIRF